MDRSEPFRVGDRVRCINSQSASIKNGSIYTVRSIRQSRDDKDVWFIRVEGAPSEEYYHYRFALVYSCSSSVIKHLRNYRDTILSRSLYDELTKLITELERQS